MLDYHWILPKTNISPLARKLAQQFQLPTYLANILIARGLTTKQAVQEYLAPHLDQLHDPSTMHDMQRGIRIIKQAIATHKKITIYGDYDVDGITSTSIMYLLLKHFGANVHYFIPNRFKDGYGPNLAEYQRLIKTGTQLLITVDNGISGLKEVTYARHHGCQVIITDHHDFPAKLPPANAIIMAKYPHHEYNPDSRGHSREDYCGAGIAFKIACAMLHRIPVNMLDLACLGTVADSVNLTSEDRIIVANGLAVINHDTRPGVIALANVSGIKLGTLSSTDLSFSLIPRLNSLGRMKDANAGVQLLTTSYMERAVPIAKETEELNVQRQEIMNREAQEALAQASTPENRKKCTLVLANRHWFPGVVGIIASRVLDKYYKPTIVIGHLSADDQQNIDRGSGRSIPEFNLFTAMDPLRKTMTSFGGHPMACGLSIKPDQINNLRSGLEKAGHQQHLESVKPTVKLDTELDLSQLTLAQIKQLDRLEPYGEGNPAPQVLVKADTIYNARGVGKQNQHLSFRLGPSFSSVHAIFFKHGQLADRLASNPHQLLLAGNLEANYFNNEVNPQLKINHMAYYRVIGNRPSRREFAIVYCYVKANRKPTLETNIIYSFNLNADDVDFIIKVFLELGLFQFTLQGDNIVYYCTKNPQHHSLSESRTYRRGTKRRLKIISLA